MPDRVAELRSKKAALLHNMRRACPSSTVITWVRNRVTFDWSNGVSAPVHVVLGVNEYGALHVEIAGKSHTLYPDSIWLASDRWTDEDRTNTVVCANRHNLLEWVLSYTQLSPAEQSELEAPAATPAPAVQATPVPTVQKKAKVTKPTKPTTAPKRDGKLPRAFLSLDLPSPQEAMPVTPFTPRATPDTYTSVHYRTKPRSRASFRSGKNPWTIPRLEIY
jgi:hypothetical protein